MGERPRNKWISLSLSRSFFLSLGSCPRISALDCVLDCVLDCILELSTVLSIGRLASLFATSSSPRERAVCSIFSKATNSKLLFFSAVKTKTLPHSSVSWFSFSSKDARFLFFVFFFKVCLLSSFIVELTFFLFSGCVLKFTKLLLFFYHSNLLFLHCFFFVIERVFRLFHFVFYSASLLHRKIDPFLLITGFQF